MNRNKWCQNSLVCFSNEKMIFVFVGLKYDSVKPNHAKKSQTKSIISSDNVINSIFCDKIIITTIITIIANINSPSSLILTFLPLPSPSVTMSPTTHFVTNVLMCGGPVSRTTCIWIIYSIGSHFCSCFPDS